MCNSDGYVGQVCLLNIKNEPTVEACIAVCSARIICIAAVPGLKGRSVCGADANLAQFKSLVVQRYSNATGQPEASAFIGVN